MLLGASSKGQTLFIEKDGSEAVSWGCRVEAKYEIADERMWDDECFRVAVGLPQAENQQADCFMFYCSLN